MTQGGPDRLQGVDPKDRHMPTSPHVLYVDHDATWQATEQDEFDAYLPDASFTTLGSEHEFRTWLEQLQVQGGQIPDVAIFDARLRWSGIIPNIPPRPPEVVAGDFRRAGLRCASLLRDNPSTSRVPIILFTTTPYDDVIGDLQALRAKGGRVDYREKDGGMGLIHLVQRLVQPNPRGR